MTVLHQIETPSATWTASGELTAVPAAANDNDLQSREQMLIGLGASIYGLSRDFPLPLPALAPVIAISGAAGSGKSTVSDFLALRFSYTKTKFAGPLKDMMRALGLDDRQIEGDLKEVPSDWLGGQTPRHAMQTLGTEWGRKCMGVDFWVEMWAKSTRLPVVVDDCRFANEAAAVRRMGGRVLRLVGRGGIEGGHVSESHDFIADEVIVNDGSIMDLKARVAQVIEGWRG